MAQTTLSRCDCCGSLADCAQFELCPTCQYPMQPDKEQHFLEDSIRDLQRVARYGGSSLRVLDLIRRYEGRLQFLNVLRSSRVASVASPEQPDLASSETSAASTTRSSEALRSVVQPPTIAHPVVRSVAEIPVVLVAHPAAMPVQPAVSMRGFSLSGDAMVNVLAAVGGFLVLAGVLSTVFVTSSLWLSFLVVLGIHIAFGGASLITRRSSLLRAVSPLYTIIFALMVPLLAFSAYRLVANNLVSMSIPYLLTLAALYAAIIYGVLAVVQRFVPFAYLGCVALLVGDLALAQALYLAYWWWPSFVMLLALATLVALPHSSGPDLFAEQRAILRTPLLVLMYTVVVGAAVFAPVVWLNGLTLDSVSPATRSFLLEPRLALLVLSCLFVVWFALWLWFTRELKRTPLLVYLCLITFFLFGNALFLDLTGFVLLETGAALLYHILVRVARNRFAAFGFPDRTLDGLAFGLIALVLLQTSAVLPFQLISRTFVGSLVQETRVIRYLSFSFTASANDIQDLFALVVCFLVTFDLSLVRAGFNKKPTNVSWCWLLFFSGLLLSACYGLEVLLWQIYPLWALLAFSLALLGCAVVLRRWISSAWAYPVELLALCGIAFTLFLSVSQTWKVISGLLLGFAALLYLVSLYQRRPLPSLLTTGLLLLMLVSLQNHLIVVLALGLLLPLLVAVLRRARLFGGQQNEPMELCAWSLLVPALIYGLVLAGSDINAGQSVFASWSGTHLSVAYELVVLGLAWYAAALIAHERLWLFPATLFWLLAMLQPVNNFWVLSLLTPCLALLGAVIEKRANAHWAIPFYLQALFGIGMAIFSGFAGGHVTALSWFLLGYALLAYGLGLVSDRIAELLLMVLCSTLAVYIAASQLGDLYRPPIVAIVGAGLGLVAGRIASTHERSALRYALPFYASGLIAALLTGIYGSLGDLSRPFYGAIPDALFLYALIACVVLWIERRAHWNWLVAIFAGWGVLLTQRLTVGYVLGAGVAMVLVGLLSEQLVRRVLLVQHRTQSEPRQPMSVLVRVSWAWHWPWYSAFLVAALVLGSWPSAAAPVVPGMLAFTLLTLVVMVERRAPELLIVPVGLATWTISLWLSAAGSTSLIVAYTLLCVLIYVTQFILRWLWPALAFRASVSWLPNLFSLGGLCVVLLLAWSWGAILPMAGLLAQAGIFALVTLSVLLFIYGLFHRTHVESTLPKHLAEAVREALLATARAVQHRCYYAVGLLLSLATSWELLAFGQTRFDTLTLVPASYLIIIAPFLLRNQALSERHWVGPWVALLGSALLLLPALWFSFQGVDLLPTSILLVEAFLLLLLGLLLRMRIFILSSAALIIVGTLRLLFLSMPPSVPILLLVFGSMLMALATALILARHRLQTAWSRWE